MELVVFLLLLLQNQIDEVRCSSQGSDAADREFRRCGDGSCQSVRYQEEKSSEEQRVGEQPPVVAAKKQSRHMRHNQSDETDGTAEGHHYGD